MRRGQVALYLVAILVAITVLVMMNVSIFLSVRARNHAMNAGDAAAIAVARGQGELLNRIGRLNVEHLRRALEDDWEGCEETASEAQRLAFVGPLDLIAAGNLAARENGAEADSEMQKLLLDHVTDVRMHYATNPEIYPPPWEGAWEEYAHALEIAAASPVYAGPDNICFHDDAGGHLLLNPNFYDAVAGNTWCWFKFNAPGLLEGYGGYGSWDPLPGATPDLIRRRVTNSEVYSLNLHSVTGSALQLLGTNLIMRLTGCSEADIERSSAIGDGAQRWMFYDAVDAWHRWYEIDPYGPDAFPVVGPVRPEYDVRGCAAVCRVRGESGWIAAAKPFGTVEDERGELARVTDLGGFVTPAFSDVRLVPVDSVGGSYLGTCDPDWMRHVRCDLPIYLERGPFAVTGRGCWYCDQLATFDRATFRRAGATWLKYHGEECERPLPGSCGGTGGARHGH